MIKGNYEQSILGCVCMHVCACMCVHACITVYVCLCIQNEVPYFNIKNVIYDVNKADYEWQWNY